MNFFSAVEQLASASGLPASIDAGEFHSDFPGQLTDYLVGRYLLDNHAALGAVSSVSIWLLETFPALQNFG